MIPAPDVENKKGGDGNDNNGKVSENYLYDKNAKNSNSEHNQDREEQSKVFPNEDGDERKPTTNADAGIQDSSIRLRDGIWPPDPLPNEPNFDLLRELKYNLTNAGAMGKSYKLSLRRLPTEEKKKLMDSFSIHSMNEYFSNIIGVRRTLEDIRLEGCAERYPSTGLPQTSIIICFVNEAWSTLLRTVNSALDNSPAHLVKEIILVDDGSTWDFLGRPLEVYMSRYGKVKIVRTGSGLGLMKARMLGYNHTTAPTVTFLDSHCECFPGWLEPLLAPLVSDHTVVTTPVIHHIKVKSFGVKITEKLQIGMIDIPSMTFKWKYVPPREQLRRNASQVENARSPAMAGGLFSITKKFFNELGGFDPQMETWGGENIEMSFKIWMCGGRIETSPCSNVGHIFHRHSSYAGLRVNAERTNIARVAAVWMDDYTKFITGHETMFENIGNLSERRAIRERLQCNSFQWYTDYVIPEMTLKGDGIYTGQIRSVKYSSQCLDVMPVKKDTLSCLAQCQAREELQKFDLSDQGEVMSESGCLRVMPSTVAVRLCDWGGKDTGQYWEYKDKQLLSSDNTCLTANSTDTVMVKPCDGSQAQQWTWTFNRPPRLKLP